MKPDFHQMSACRWTLMHLLLDIAMQVRLLRCRNYAQYDSFRWCFNSSSILNMLHFLIISWIVNGINVMKTENKFTKCSVCTILSNYDCYVTIVVLFVQLLSTTWNERATILLFLSVKKRCLHQDDLIHGLKHNFFEQQSKYKWIILKKSKYKQVIRNSKERRVDGVARCFAILF